LAGEAHLVLERACAPPVLPDDAGHARDEPLEPPALARGLLELLFERSDPLPKVVTLAFVHGSGRYPACLRTIDTLATTPALVPTQSFAPPLRATTIDLGSPATLSGTVAFASIGPASPAFAIASLS